MNRIDSVFRRLGEEGKKALIPYISCGYPNLEFTEQLILTLAENGADLIELGVPYSDPVADGPTIQKASAMALENGVTLENIFELVKRVRKKSNTPLILMTYYNPIYVKGIETFVAKAAEVGVDGLIIPDIPVEEGAYLQEVAGEYDINVIFLVAPTSTPERIEKIAKLSKGFIYCVSVTGITGARKEISDHLEGFLGQIREKTKMPLAVGFGISDPKTAKRAAALSDGVIVGSALIEQIMEELERNSEEKALEKAGEFVGRIKEAME